MKILGGIYVRERRWEMCFCEMFHGRQHPHYWDYQCDENDGVEVE